MGIEKLGGGRRPEAMRVYCNWHNWPIQRKLILIILTTVFISLLLVVTGTVIYDFTRYRALLAKELTELSSFLAANSAPALAFDDQKTAQEILNTLRASPEIAIAVLHTTTGRVFASYVRVDKTFTPPPRPKNPGLYISGRRLELIQDIKEKGILIGTIYLQADIAGVYTRLKGYAGIMLVAAFTLIGAAFLLQILLQRLISKPLLRLSHMAARIATGDLTVRVPEFSGDEIGQLGKALNHMTAELARSYTEVQQTIGRLQSANKELEAFSYSVSHDLRAPLRHITGFVELFTKRAGESLDEKSRHYLQVITDAADKMGELIDDILAFSRAGRTEMNRKPVDFNALVTEVIQDFSAETQGRDVKWKIQSLPVVFGDPSLLRQVWVNLISNALKFTFPRKNTIIDIGYRKEKTKYVFFVKDNGVGFDMTYKDKLFGLFQRLHPPGEFEGTGVGLANVRRIVTRHGGNAWAESILGEGATFYFSIQNEGGGGG